MESSNWKWKRQKRQKGGTVKRYHERNGAEEGWRQNKFRKDVSPMGQEPQQSEFHIFGLLG